MLEDNAIADQKVLIAQIRLALRVSKAAATLSIEQVAQATYAASLQCMFEHFGGDAIEKKHRVLAVDLLDTTFAQFKQTLLEEIERDDCSACEAAYFEGHKICPKCGLYLLTSEDMEG